jgi:hypothetical protein
MAPLFVLEGFEDLEVGVAPRRQERGDRNQQDAGRSPEGEGNEVKPQGITEADQDRKNPVETDRDDDRPAEREADADDPGRDTSARVMRPS